MNNNFVLLNKNTNIEKNAHMIVKFNFEEKDYLVYCVEENEQNSQIFVSKLIKNSEGNYFIDDISTEEKGKLSNIVYNIVILVPSDIEKGNDFQTLVNNLFSKFSVKLLNGLPSLDNQEYYSNCSIAITNKTLVENAVRLYNDKLNVIVENHVSEVPMWTAPTEVTAPTPIEESTIAPIEEPTVVVSSIPVAETVVPSMATQENTEKTPEVPVEEPVVVTPEVEIPSLVINEPVVSSEVVNSIPTPVEPVMPVSSNSDEVVLPNPQTEKLAIVSDPSLGIGVQQPNVMQNKKAGFANTKYIVIGSVCLVLSIAVVVAAYFLIKNIA